MANNDNTKGATKPPKPKQNTPERIDKGATKPDVRPIKESGRK
jgi:hypothetical protein